MPILFFQHFPTALPECPAISAIGRRSRFVHHTSSTSGHTKVSKAKSDDRRNRDSFKFVERNGDSPGYIERRSSGYTSSGPNNASQGYRIGTPQKRPTDAQLEYLTAEAIRTGFPKSTAEATGALAGVLRSKNSNFKDLEMKWQYFGDEIMASFKSTDLSASRPDVPGRRQIEISYMKGGLPNMITMLHMNFLTREGYREKPNMLVQQDNMEAAADSRFPHEWYVATRQLQRVWHLHVGPTNSGKTYNALKRLKESGNGIYAGPLRLLAQEIYERFNAEGIPCNLVMGDSIITVDPDAGIESSTMEMVDLNNEVEVCVIDEIQMIGDTDRGWAWTQAVLGVRAKEVHMCGEERTVEIIQKLAASVGEELIIHRYNRLGPLEVEPKSLAGDLKQIEKGDCVVTFSRRNIFAMKRMIEQQTGKRCAVIYGSLPPETRSLQANLFNDPKSEYEILVASDAVGMGLNLSIKRVIFETTTKWNGEAMVGIDISSIKQIAGRAGRFKVPGRDDGPVALGPDGKPLPPKPQVGWVTTLEPKDLRAVKSALQTNVEPIRTAGILPTVAQIEYFASQYPENTKFSDIMKKMLEYIKVSELFHTCDLKESIEVAAIFDDIKELSVADRMTFIMSPINSRNERACAVARRMAECVAWAEDGSVLKLYDMDLEALDILPTTTEDLQRLETLHKMLIHYLWISYRFPATFHPRQTAEELKDICERQIEKGLQAVKFTRARQDRVKKIRANYTLEELSQVPNDPSSTIDLSGLDVGTYSHLAQPDEAASIAETHAEVMAATSAEVQRGQEPEPSLEPRLTKPNYRERELQKKSGKGSHFKAPNPIKKAFKKNSK
ncbi:P-loop containing nucleoside triphosphate hydrolase protein [Pyronema domesticum]|nr:P-loop containing nucleoside triphosphate hydrolase protein [Pyronema domesticum]